MFFYKEDDRSLQDITRSKLVEREKYLMKKLDWSPEYMHKVYVYLLEQKPFNKSVGYCGRGNSAAKNECLSSKAVPDFKSKNFSCKCHDDLYNAIKIKHPLITKDLADKFFLYSMYFDAGYNPFKRVSSWLYYKSVCFVEVE